MSLGITRRTLFGLAAGAYAESFIPKAVARPPEGTHPELGIIARLGPDTPVMRSQVAQLLERGVYFPVDAAGNLPASVAEQLDGYRALLFDGPAYEAALHSPTTRNRVESWMRRGGLVFRIDDPLDASARARVNRNLLVDLVASDCTHHLMVLAGLTPLHPEMKRQLLERPDGAMMDGLKANLLANMKTLGSRWWGENNLHYWKAAKALVDSGKHPELRAILTASIRECIPHLTGPNDFDRTAGYFGIAWLHDQTGDRAGVDAARGNLDAVIARRPRLAGILTGTGYADDPLGLGFEPDNQASIYMNNTIVESKVIPTESLHMYGPAFASMSRVTGDPKYVAEVVKLAAHVAKHHVRPNGTVAHVSHDGRWTSPAWGRGQSHALYGTLYILEELPPGHKDAKALVDFIRRAGEGARKYQDASTGLWRNVVDNPTARLESSGSVGITYVYARAIREGWVDRSTFQPMVLKAWEGLKQRYWRGGLAGNVSVKPGTGRHGGHHEPFVQTNPLEPECGAAPGARARTELDQPVWLALSRSRPSVGASSPAVARRSACW